METKKLCEKAGIDVLAVTCDVSKKDELIHFFDQAAEKFGTIDALVNNAAHKYSSAPLLDQTDEELENAFATGLFAVWNAMERVGEPATDIPPVVAFLMSDNSRWITGQNINIDGGACIYGL